MRPCETNFVFRFRGFHGFMLVVTSTHFRGGFRGCARGSSSLLAAATATTARSSASSSAETTATAAESATAGAILLIELVAAIT